MADLSFDDLVPAENGQTSPSQAVPALPSVASTPAVTPTTGTNFDDLVPASKGMFWPVSTDAQGNKHLDWSAGITGAIGQLANAAASAVAAPYDAYTGQIPMPTTGTLDNAAPAVNRALDFASVFSPGSAAARAGEVIPGTLAKEAVPTAQQLKNAADAQYNAARASGVEINGDAVGDMARGLQNSLQSDRGIIAKTAPKTYSILDELANPPAGSTIAFPGLDAARQGLSSLRLEGGTEGLAAGHAVRGLDNFMSSLGDVSNSSALAGATSPEDIAQLAQTYRDARGNYAAAQRSNDITGTLDRANTGILEQAQARAEASHSGQNLDNTIRQRVASYLQNPQNLAGFSQPEIDALKGVVAGGPIQNTARYASNLLGGGGGMHGALAPTLGAIIGGHLGGAEGAGAGAAIPALAGRGLKGIENSLATRSLNAADETIRQNSPLYQQMKLADVLAQPKLGASNAIWRPVLPIVVSPQTGANQ